MEGNQQRYESALAQELGALARLFPTVAREELQAVLNAIPLEKKYRLATGEEGAVPRLLSADSQVITWQGVQVAIPYRVYFQEPVPAAEQLRRVDSGPSSLLVANARVTGRKRKVEWRVTGLAIIALVAGEHPAFGTT